MKVLDIVEYRSRRLLADFAFTCNEINPPEEKTITLTITYLNGDENVQFLC